MADAVTPAAVAPAVAPAPVVEAPPAVAPVAPPVPVVAPVVATPVVSQETIPVAVPVEAVKPAEPAKPVEAAPAEPAKTPSLLADAKPPEKPVEAAPAEPTAPVTPEPLKYEAFKLPDGVTVADESLTPFTEILGKNHVPQEAAQALVDKYVEMEQRRVQLQHDNWERTQQALQAEFKADKDIGGTKWEATIQDCGKVLSWFGQKHGSQHEQSLRQAFIATGLGNHAEFIRLLSDFSGFVAEKSAPVVALKPAQPVTKAGRRYRDSIPPPNGAA